MGLIKRLSQGLHGDCIFDGELYNFARLHAELLVNDWRFLVFGGLGALEGRSSRLLGRVFIVVIDAVIGINCVHHSIGVCSVVHERLIALLELILALFLRLRVLVVKLVSELLLHLVAQKVEL